MRTVKLLEYLVQQYQQVVDDTEHMNPEAYYKYIKFNASEFSAGVCSFLYIMNIRARNRYWIERNKRVGAWWFAIKGGNQRVGLTLRLEILKEELRLRKKYGFLPPFITKAPNRP